MSSRVVIGATFTAEPLREPLDFFLRLLRAKGSLEFAPFSQVFQALLDPAGLFARNTDGVNVVLLRGEDLGGSENVSGLVEAVETYARRQPARLLMRVCAGANTDLEEELGRKLIGLAGVTMLTSAEQDRRYPVVSIFDRRAQALGAIPYTDEYFAALAASLARALHRVLRPQPKVIVLDCDDTLWGGICGEDGPSGVTLDGPRLALQDFMADQRRNGRLLAIASKNNEADVLETFRLHPEMPLQLGDFAARRINWDSKALSIPSIAHELNLGLDSFVFLDDNAKESAEVAAELPEVISLTLPADANRIPQFLEHVWALDSPEKLTEEDRNRTVLYEQQTERRDWEQRARTLEEFIAGLALEVDVQAIESESMARVAQLTQRTNQMNASTRRRSEAELIDFLRRDKGLAVKVRDRFGDYGLVGALLFTDEDDVLVIDTFVLSCRALGRGVEHRMLRHAGEEAVARGLRRVLVTFESTARNAPARDFLASVAGVTEPPFVFEAAELVKLAYHPAKNVPPAPAVLEKAGHVAIDEKPDYQAIAELRSMDEILAAVRRERIANAPQFPFRPSKRTAPQTDLERRLCDLWSRMLGVPDIGTGDNFFDLGGHSLLAVQLVSRLHEEFGVDLPLEAVYSGTLTVAELAETIEVFQLGAAGGDDYADLLAAVEGLSDEEAETLLAREMNPEPRP